MFNGKRLGQQYTLVGEAVNIRRRRRIDDLLVGVVLLDHDDNVGRRRHTRNTGERPQTAEAGTEQGNHQRERFWECFMHIFRYRINRPLFRE